MYKLTLYVPDSHLALLKEALFAVGAGQMGDYEQCCWQTKGMGQFRPRANAQPCIGQIGQLTQVEEWRVEMVVLARYREVVLEALLQYHPYEKPAFDFIEINTGAGLVGWDK